MDPRLVPVNGLIALLRGEGGWPDLLRGQGFERHLLEVTLTTRAGDTRADAVIYRQAPDLVLVCECKSGTNIDEDQARRYAAATADGLRRTDAVPPLLRQSADVDVQPMFVGTEEHRAALERALRELAIDAPLLTVGSHRVRLSDSSGVNGLDDFDEVHSGGLPPSRVSVDHQSPDSELREVLLPQVVAAMARDEDFLAIESVCAAVLPEWPILAPGPRGEFIKRAEGVVRGLAMSELRGRIRLEPGPRGGRSRIAVISTPASNRPQGRTQAWQAQQRRAAQGLRGGTRPAIEGQTSLDDLAAEGGLADE